MAGIGGGVTVSDDARRAADSPLLLVADPGAAVPGCVAAAGQAPYLTVFEHVPHVGAP